MCSDSTSSQSQQDELQRALEALSASVLREFVIQNLDWLPDLRRKRIEQEIIEQAARVDASFVSQEALPDVLQRAQNLLEEGLEEGWANPEEVDEILLEGRRAFLRRDYALASGIFGLLLEPLAECEICLGQHEMLEEVLSVEMMDCAAKYVVAEYMLAEPATRAVRVQAAITLVCACGGFHWPLMRLEQTAIEELPDFEAFLRDWQILLERMAANHETSLGVCRAWTFDGIRSHVEADFPKVLQCISGDMCKKASGNRTDRGDEDREAVKSDRLLVDGDLQNWRREVALRLEGIAGLARISHSSGRSADYRAWCRELRQQQAWAQLLEAADEAAQHVEEQDAVRLEFMEEAAFAAQKLQCENFRDRLWAIWRSAPSFKRLLRVLGGANNAAEMGTLAKEALALCPVTASKERALLHLLRHEIEPSAALLGEAAGLGWSGEEHPGYLLFHQFCLALGCDTAELLLPVERVPDWREFIADPSRPSFARVADDLPVPEPQELLNLTGGFPVLSDEERPAILHAMSQAAERRLAEVASRKYRRLYAQAATLATLCVQLDPSAESAEWLLTLRQRYRRFSALQAEFDALTGRALLGSSVSG